MGCFLAFFALLLVAASTSASATYARLDQRRGRWHWGRGIDDSQTAPRRLLEWERWRLMSGPGSWPPSCRSKCGRCDPCSPVHVPVQPGASQPMEYYPEAWRCKCGGKLFMP